MKVLILLISVILIINYYSIFGNSVSIKNNKFVNINNNNYNNENHKIKFVDDDYFVDSSDNINIWPHPYKVKNGEKNLIVSPNFKFSTNLTTSISLNKAIKRYNDLIFKQDSNEMNCNSCLNELNILIISEDETLQLGFDESYNLTIEEDGSNAQLISGSIYGAIRGLETFYQLVEYSYSKARYSINNCPWYIIDRPRFPHRGVMLDTSRHYYPIDVLLEFIDTLAYNKYNVFHWHAVDAQSFALTSKSFPKLTKGAWSDKEIYSTKDITNLIQYAKERGIRVELEIDMPGHSYSWGIGYPEVLPFGYNATDSVCASNPCPYECNIPLDPSSGESYKIAMGLLEEFANDIMFNEEFFHIGGDEVIYDCWNHSINIAEWMIDNNITDLKNAAVYFESKAIEKLIQLKRSPVMWEDAYFLFGSNNLPKEVIVQVYHNPLLAANTTRDGYRTIQSSYWPNYLDSPSTWEMMYSNNPVNGIDPSNLHLFLGGETCMWSELVDPSNIFTKVWPRASATAERLWSGHEISNVTLAAPRLEKFRCSLLDRSIGAAPLNSTSPLGPNSCYNS